MIRALFRIAAVVAVVSFSLGVASRGGVASAKGTTQINFRQAWIPDQLYVPYMTALDKGYYGKEGIKFVNQVGSGAGTSTKLVGSGSTPIGKGGASVVLQAIAAGIPITIVMTEDQNDPSGVCALKSSGIKTGRDLLGKTIATSPGDTTQAEVIAAMRKSGLDPSSIHWVNVDPAQWESALVGKRVDAIGCDLSSQPVDFAAQGVQVSTISVAKLGLKVPYQTVFVNNSYLKTHRSVVRAFVLATLQGYRYAVEHPAYGGKAVHHHYPEADASIITKKWKTSFPFLHSSATKKYGTGWNNKASFKNLVALLKSSGQLTTSLNLNKVYTNSVLQSIPLKDRKIAKLH